MCSLYGKQRRDFCVVLLQATIVTILLTAFGCASSLTAPRPVVHEKYLREICWYPAELVKNDESRTEQSKESPKRERFVFPANSDQAVPESQEAVFDAEVRRGGLVFQFVRGAPVANLKLVPLSRTDVWCEGIPDPPDWALPFLRGGPEAAAPEVASPVEKLYVAQSSGPAIKSRFFCEQQARLAPTTQETILLRARTTAYMEAYRQAERIAQALTIAEAESQEVLNKDDWTLRNLIATKPDSIEAIQDRLVHELDSIESPPAYDDCILDGLALAGYQMGFDNGKFETEAKLFAIDAAWVVLDIAVTEVILGPLGGAKLAASGLAKGSKALKASLVRLGEIPIFLPVGVGTGAIFKIKTVIQPVSAWAHRSALRKAVEKLYGVGRGTGETTHHIVALNDHRAEKAREVLKKFGIHIDEGANGVFLPASTKSPNPKGALVHSKLHTNEYYRKVEFALGKAKSKADAMRTLQRIRETLLDGTFHNANL